MSVLDRNRLDEEASPYLLQHADNPVHWQPWDEPARELARSLDRPIFLSIGYAACHWCHVMEEESFTDEPIADRLNEYFVPIKVDREERPDLDRLYQTTCQQVTGGGGWPLSVWMTPDGRPFYVGTYFPPSPRRGMPGFADVLEQLAASWRNEREAIEARADEWTDAMRKQVESIPEPGPQPDDAVLPRAAERMVAQADRQFGGFGSDGPKFPHPTRINLLLEATADTGDDRFESVALGALDAMAEGGIYDHVGGGFHRYATDRAWQIPHFEKMLYDNATLLISYLGGYQVTGRERYARIVDETITFIEQELTHPDGGFYSTLDAQSDGKEGAYYVLTPEDVQVAAPDPQAAEIWCHRYGITDAGSVEGANVPAITAEIGDLADEFGMEPETIHAMLDAVREALRAARTNRIRPARDEKILAGWNGLMIHGLAEAALVRDPVHRDLARAALSFVKEHHWNGDRLARRWKDGAVGIAGYLDDYAYLARGAIACHEATGNTAPLGFALDLADAMIEEFWDEDAGTFYYTPHTGEKLVGRPQDQIDQSLPASVAVAGEVLDLLTGFTPDRGYDDRVETILETYGTAIDRAPLQHASLVSLAHHVVTGRLEITIAADELPEPWRRFVADRYLPRRLLTRRPPTTIDTVSAKLSLPSDPPIWAGRSAVDSVPTAYLCRSFTCSPPLTEPTAATDWLGRLRP